MKVITRKPIVQALLAKCLEAYEQSGVAACATAIYEHMLCAKVKFPLLEYAANTLFEEVNEEDLLKLTDQLESYKTEGGNVLLGILLQKSLNKRFDTSIERAVVYISKGKVWYVADLIGERVFGYALLNWPEKTIQQLHKLGEHPNNLVVRSLGAGSHYAVKKGLPKEQVESLFRFLLTLANAKDHQIRQGIGWAAKTTAKFHPEIITLFKNDIEDENKVAKWFRKKVAIGLDRYNYAQRNKR